MKMLYDLDHVIRECPLFIQNIVCQHPHTMTLKLL